MLDILILAANILGWSLLAILLATLISLLVVRVILGVHFSLILKEIEEHQNGAIGIIFQGSALVVSVLLLVFTFDGFTPTDDVLGAIIWTLAGFLLTLFFMFIFGFILLRWLSGRKHLRETPIGYLRRELIQERNQALAHILMAILLVIGIAVTSQIM